MELESLKEIWTEDEQKDYSSTEADLFRIIESPSRFPIAKMLKSVRFEIMLSVLLYSAVCIYFLVELNRQFILVSLFMAAWGVIYVVYLLKKQQLLKKLYISATPLRTGLEQQIDILRKYAWMYVIAGTIQLPVTIMVLFLIYLKQAPIPGPVFESYLHTFTSLRGLLLSGGFLVIIGLVGYGLNKWYVNRLYGQHIKNLRDLVMELDSVS